MKLYLARHGQAAATEPDESRALTGRGRLQVERLALFLGTSGVEAECVYHSHLRRAHETAEILAKSLSSTMRCEPYEGLGPGDPADGLLDRIAAFTGDTMLVTHLPQLERLLALLVVGSPGPRLASIPPGTVMCLERLNAAPIAGWHLDWMVPPTLLGDVDYVPQVD